MQNENKNYFFPRVIISIILVFFFLFLHSCKVNALEPSYYYLRDVSDSSYNVNNFAYAPTGTKRYFTIDNNNYVVEYKSDGIYVNDTKLSNISRSGYYAGFNVFRDITTNYVYFIAHINSSNVYFLDSTVNQLTSLRDVPVKLNRLSTPASSLRYGGYIIFNGSQVVDSNSYLSTAPSVNCGGSDWGQHCFTNNSVDWYGGSNRVDLRTGFPNGNATANDYYYSSDFNDGYYDTPTIDLQYTQKTKNGVLQGYDFVVSYSIFNLQQYKYLYWYCSDYYCENQTPQKLEIQENNFEINSRANGTYYFSIEDLNDNIVDSQSFSINNVGDFVKNPTYNINFSSKNNLADNFSNGLNSRLIESVTITADFIPVSSILTYEYQYVVEGSELDENNWLVLPQSSKGQLIYTATENGVLYTRIIKDNEIMFSATFSNSLVGTYENVPEDNFFNKLSRSINFGGPISGIINIPINFYKTIVKKSNSCNNVNFGSIYGHNLSINCIDIEDFFGSTLWNIIDLIVSGMFAYYLSNYFIKFYISFMNIDLTDHSRKENW